MHIGRNILHIRTIKQIKQDDIATRLGISQQAYSRIEKRSTIREATLTKIAKEFGVEVSFLTSPDVEQVANSISGNHSTNIQIVLNFEINSSEKCSMPDLTELTRSIEELARRAMNDGISDDFSGAQSSEEL